MASEIERPRNCDNCRHATDYWPMYCGDDHRKWGTVRCSKDSPRKAKRYKLTHTCKRWIEQESSHD